MRRSAGFLFMQASILMAGVSDISHPHETSVADFLDVEVRDDGSLVTHIPVDELKNDPQHTERRLIRRMGTTMTEAMIAAFACELAMKAISLTCNDEADKTHDLLALYETLPDRSRERICADFPDITDVIRKGRHRFGAWRYFETRVGDAAIEGYLQNYNDEFPAATTTESEMKNVFALIDEMDLPSDSRAWKKADLFTLLVELHRALFKTELSLQPAALGRQIQEFYKLVESIGPENTPANADPQLIRPAASYYVAALQATNDRSSRSIRGDVIRRVIKRSQ